MKSIRKIAALLILGFLALSPVFSANITIKVASVAPEQSPWGLALNRIAADWARISGGRVTLKVYHNGIAGDESDSLRKMRIGQVQAIVLTSFGLAEIDPDFIAISLPALVRNEAELSHVLDKLRPRYESMLKKAGLVPIAWSKAGWVKFFGKQPILYPSDLKSMKLSVGGQNDNFVQAWKSMGYQVVPITIPQTLSGLNSGMIDALYASPLAVGGFQWFGLAKHMLNLDISPFVGAIIMTERVWKQIPADIRPQLQESVKAVEAGLNSDVMKLEASALKTMTEYGLIIHEVPENARAQWFSEFDSSYKYLIDSVITKEMYDLVISYVKEVRK